MRNQKTLPPEELLPPTLEVIKKLGNFRSWIKPLFLKIKDLLKKKL